MYVLSFLVLLVSGIGGLIGYALSHAGSDGSFNYNGEFSESFSGYDGLNMISPSFWIALAFIVIFALATLLPNLALRTRRFHDTGLGLGLALTFMIIFAAASLTVVADNFVFFSALNSAIGLGAFLLTLLGTNAFNSEAVPAALKK